MTDPLRQRQRIDKVTPQGQLLDGPLSFKRGKQNAKSRQLCLKIIGASLNEPQTSVYMRTSLSVSPTHAHMIENLILAHLCAVSKPHAE